MTGYMITYSKKRKKPPQRLYFYNQWVNPRLTISSQDTSNSTASPTNAQKLDNIILSTYIFL